MLGEVSPTLACPKAATKPSANCTSACPFPVGPSFWLLPVALGPVFWLLPVALGPLMWLLPVGVCLAAHFSRNWEATPLLSPLMRSLVLLMEVQCTGNQLMAPVPESCKKKKVRLREEEEEEEGGSAVHREPADGACA